MQQQPWNPGVKSVTAFPPIPAMMNDKRDWTQRYGGTDIFQRDPSWRGLIPFHEYFHGDNGAGIGASHQTGWTGLVAKLFQQNGE
jgi:uncharacterized protein DUF3300